MFCGSISFTYTTYMSGLGGDTGGGQVVGHHFEGVYENSPFITSKGATCGLEYVIKWWKSAFIPMAWSSDCYCTAAASMFISFNVHLLIWKVCGELKEKKKKKLGVYLGRLFGGVSCCCHPHLLSAWPRWIHSVCWPCKHVCAAHTHRGSQSQAQEAGSCVSAYCTNEWPSGAEGKHLSPLALTSCEGREAPLEESLRHHQQYTKP